MGKEVLHQNELELYQLHEEQLLHQFMEFWCLAGFGQLPPRVLEWSYAKHALNVISMLLDAQTYCEKNGIEWHDFSVLQKTTIDKFTE